MVENLCYRAEVGGDPSDHLIALECRRQSVNSFADSFYFASRVWTSVDLFQERSKRSIGSGNFSLGQSEDWYTNFSSPARDESKCT